MSIEDMRDALLALPRNGWRQCEATKLSPHGGEMRCGFEVQHWQNWHQWTYPAKARSGQLGGIVRAANRRLFELHVARTLTTAEAERLASLFGDDLRSEFRLVVRTRREQMTEFQYKAALAAAEREVVGSDAATP